MKITILTLCLILVCVVAPPELKVIAGLLLFFITGFTIVFFTLPQKDFVDHIILSIIAGLAFQIVYSYIISLVSHFSLFSLGIPLCLSIAFDYKGGYTVTFDKRAFLIFVPAVLFGLATVNIVPGEDAIAHLLITADITNAAALPQTYSLYPEIPVLMYPLGFHSITAQLHLLSGMTDLIFGVASFLSGVLCLAVYVCAKKLFSVECGLLAGTLSVFAALTPLTTLVLSNYTTLLAFIFTCAAISVAIDMNTHLNPLLSLIVAAGVETHLLFLVVLIPLSVLLIQNLAKTSGRSVLTYGYTLGLAVILSAPFLIRLTGYYPPPMAAVQYIIEQEHHFFSCYKEEKPL